MIALLLLLVLNQSREVQGFLSLRTTGRGVLLQRTLQRDQKRLLLSSRAAFESTENSKSCVAIVGSGAVGGYYGSRLWEAGHNVSFFMRGDHYVQCKANGLNVTVSIKLNMD